MFNKKIHVTKINSNNLILNILPRITQSQLEIKQKQDYKKTAGYLSEHWLKHRNNNRDTCIDSIIRKTNYALSVHQARQILKAQQVTINNKKISNKHYEVQPFSIVKINTKYKEQTILNQARKTQKLNNPTTILNNEILIS